MHMHLSFYIQSDEEGNVLDDRWCPSYSESGEILTREAWQQITTHIEAFYATVPPETIAEQNKKREIAHNAICNHCLETKDLPEKKRGWIYIIRANKYYKIGRAQKPIERYSQLATLPPWPTEVVHTFESEDYYVMEKELHDLFSPKRVNGEWFALDDNDVEFLRSLQ